jgi:hypothetical protein
LDLQKNKTDFEKYMKDKETAIEKSVKRGELRNNENRVEKEKKK